VNTATGLTQYVINGLSHGVINESPYHTHGDTNRVPNDLDSVNKLAPDRTHGVKQTSLRFTYEHLMSLIMSMIV